MDPIGEAGEGEVFGLPGLLGGDIQRHGGTVASGAALSRLSVASQRDTAINDDEELQRAALEKASRVGLQTACAWQLLRLRRRRRRRPPPAPHAHPRTTVSCTHGHRVPTQRRVDGPRPRRPPQAFASKLASKQAVLFKGADGWQVVTMRRMKSRNAQALLDKVASVHHGQVDAQAEPFLRLIRERLDRCAPPA